MTRNSILHRPRRALAGVALLGCLAVAIPLLSNFGEGGTVEAETGFVSANRPIDRILNGTALGSRRITPVRAAISLPAPMVPRSSASPRLTQPGPLMASLPDLEPDLSITWLSVTAGYPPVDLPEVAAPTHETWSAAPRRKPAHPVRMAALAIAGSKRPTAVTLPDLAPRFKPTSPKIIIRPPDSAMPRIALVITAAGLHDASTRQAIDGLPEGVTFAFAPIGRQSGALAKTAIADGHTVLVEIPMEPLNPAHDPGEPLTLRIGNSDADNIARLDKALSSIPGASGISSYLGAKFSRSERAAAPVIDRIASRGLFLFENKPNGRSRLAALAGSRGVSYAAASTALDRDRSETRMLQRLAELETKARRDGVAIGVATAYRESIATLERWVAGAQRRGIVFIPVTRLGNAG